MKKLFLFLLLVACGLGAMADTVTSVTDTVFTNPHTVNPNDIPLGGGWQEWFTWGIGILLFVWEVILRVIPTSKDWTLFGKIVSILDWIAGLFNKGVGNAAKTDIGKGKFTKTKVSI
jgi:hypothetical protein